MRCRGQQDPDGKSAAFAGGGVQGSIVAADDGPDDGKAEPYALAAVGPGAVQAPERLEQRVEVLRWHDRTAVGHRELNCAGLPARGRRHRGHRHPAVRMVVPDAVADEVEGQPFQQDGVADGDGGVGHRVDGDVCGRCLVGGLLDRAGGDIGQVDGQAPDGLAVAAGKGEQEIGRASCRERV